MLSFLYEIQRYINNCLPFCCKIQSSSLRFVNYQLNSPKWFPPSSSTLLFTTERFLATAASSSEICMRTLSMRRKLEKMNNEYFERSDLGMVMIGLFCSACFWWISKDSLVPLVWSYRYIMWLKVIDSMVDVFIY